MTQDSTPGFTLQAARRSQFILLATYIVGAYVLVSTAAFEILGLTESRRLAANLVLFAGTAISQWLCRSGRVGLAAHALVWTGYVGITLVCYATGGFRSPASSAFLTVIAFAGWLLGIRQVVVSTAISLATMLALFVLGEAGWLPAPAPPVAILQFGTASTALALGGMLFYFVLGEMHRGWRDEIALRQDLSRANEELEAKVALRTQELSRAKDAAEQASRAKGDFLANMSHEIRTPMHAIVGLTESLRRETQDPRSRERLALVAQASDHLLTLVNNVLDISKIESGKLELAAVEMRIGEVCARVLAMLDEEARRKGLVLASEVDIVAGRRVMGDPTRLLQVLLNFAGNALKFTQSGVVTLRCRPEGGDGVYRFEIEDTGPGISAEDQARVFDSFEQLAASAAQPGSGLGLAINRYLVRAMGGEVGVESRSGAGSLFWFTARFDPAPLAADPADLLRAEAGGDDALEARLRASFAGRRVLVVDDNEVNRIVARAQLDAVGLRPDEAADGLQAIAAVAREDYDLILMDVHMPELDGVEATRRIRAMARYRDTPIIALTADAFSADRKRFLDAGMSDHLPKPMQARDLYAALARWLAEPAAERPAA